MNISRLSKIAAVLCLCASTAALSTSYAQNTAAAAKDDETVRLEKFEVTGSYLPLSGTVQASPVVTVQRQEIGLSGATDPLRLLKQLTPFFSGNGNVGTEVNNGGAGEANVALRNLRTLVLLNGKRVVTSAISNTNGGSPSVDLNTIPTGMIERIEIVKDGASTLYGSDAIGGVVNVILRKNYNGFELGTRYGSTGSGDYVTRETYVIGGVTTKSGSLTVGAQHFENTTLRTTDRALTTMTPAKFAALGTAPGGIPASMSGTFAGRVSNHILAGSPLAAGATGFRANITSPGMKSSPTAAPQTLAQLEAAGVYIPISSTPLYREVGSVNILNTTLYGNPLIVPTKRNQFVASGERELAGKSLEVFGDFLFTQTTTGGSGLAPSPVTLGSANTLTIPANNPYNLFGVTLGIGAPSGAPSIRNRLEELGNRSSVNEANTFRVVTGFRGDITENLKWELTYLYSRNSATQRVLGGANGANMNQLMIPLIQNGNYVISNGRPLSVLTDSSGNNLPVYNYFALPGFNDPATLNAIRTTLFKNAVTSLRGVDLLVRGKVFEVPAGDVAIAFGGENRKEDLVSSVDALYANGLALGYNPADTFAGGSRSNKAVFGETTIPLISPKQNLPGFYQLDLTSAIRYEKIQPGGHSTTPRLGLRWMPFDATFTVRSTWSEGFIAPDIFDLFGPAQGNAPSYTILEGNGSTSAGGATGRMVTGQYGSASELSNPNLKPQTSKAFTVGFVYSPKQIKGLSFTADYYHISQDKVGDIDYSSVYADLNAKGAGSAYAAGFSFIDNTRLVTNAPNQVTSTNVGTLAIATNPSGDQMTEGLDLAVDYTWNANNLGRFNIGANANVLFNYKFRGTPRDKYNQYARNFTDSTNGLGGQNGTLASYVLKPYINHSIAGLATSLYFTHIPKVNNPGMLFGGQSPTNTQRLDGKAYTMPSYTTVDLALSYQVPNFGRSWLKGFVITAGVNNLFGKDAPYVPGGGNNSSESNTDKSTYDIIGRFMFMELKKAF
ncbi:MAG: TonB-dependent receptor [Opitutae bacterium]|nr:TonB-dependent receptor [Opitutae bacterium]